MEGSVRFRLVDRADGSEQTVEVSDVSTVIGMMKLEDDDEYRELKRTTKKVLDGEDDEDDTILRNAKRRLMTDVMNASNVIEGVNALRRFTDRVPEIDVSDEVTLKSCVEFLERYHCVFVPDSKGLGEDANPTATRDGSS